MQKTKLHRLAWISAAAMVAAFGGAALVGWAGGLFGPGAGPRWGGPGTAIDQREVLEAAGAGRVTVRAVSSRVVVTDGEDGRVTARLAGEVYGGREEAAPRLTAEARDGQIVIRVEHPFKTFHFYRENLVLTVGLPRDWAGALAVTSVSGEVEVADHEFAELAVRTTSGEVRIGAVRAGSIALHSVSGELEARAATARVVELGTTSGEITAGALSGEVRARSVSGEVALSWSQVGGPAEVVTTSGDADLTLPAGAAFRLEASSTSGDVSCGFPITVEETGGRRRKHALTGQVGTGGPPLKVRTVSGEIRVGP